LSNAGVLTGTRDTVVIDTMATVPRARALRAAVDRLSPGTGRLLVNTHHHGDHTFGNAVFGPSAAILAHRAAYTEMADTGLALTRLWPDVAWGAVEVTLPTVTFEERVTVHLGDRQAELIHLGTAHTTNDVVVWLPAERVLFAGDVVLSGATPFALMGSVAGSLAVIEQLRALDPVTVVCGHGPVTGPQAFGENANYLQWVWELARTGLANGWTPLRAAREGGPGRFGDWSDPERLVGNLHRAYAELGGAAHGVPLDVVSIFGEMVEYNDGRLPACLA
jgi:cyclase